MIFPPDRETASETVPGAPAMASLPCLDAAAFHAFRSLRPAAVEAVARQLAAQSGGDCVSIDRPPWDSCREELFALLDFLEPSVEFGVLQPMSDFLDWTTRRSSPRAIDHDQLLHVLPAFADFFARVLDPPQGHRVADLLGAVRAVFARTRQQRDGWLPRHDEWPETGRFCAALVEGRQPEALEIMHRCLSAGHGLVEFGLNVLQPAMHDIGRRWQGETLSVAVEHQAAGIARTVMAVGLARSTARPSNGCTVLLAGVEGNEHDLGLQIVADGYRLAGWQVHCLGGNVPTPDLVQYAIRLAPQVLGLSVAFAHQLRLVRSVACGIGAPGAGPRPVIVAGGLAAVRYERLTLRLGADAVAADAASAIALTPALLQRRSSVDAGPPAS
jgi:methanogenic corrinoid protein MtbC1